jgi:hypothetical protein
MKRFLSRRRLAFVIASALVFLLAFVFIEGNQIARVYVLKACESDADAVEILRNEFDRRSGDFNIATYGPLVWQRREIGIVCGRGEIAPHKSFVLTYYPRRHALGYGNKGEPLKTIYGVTRADIERVANAGGTLKDFE